MFGGGVIGGFENCLTVDNQGFGKVEAMCISMNFFHTSFVP